MKEVPFPEIPYEEYRSRIQKLKELIKKNKLDGLCLFSRSIFDIISAIGRQVLDLPNGGAVLPSSTVMEKSFSSYLKFIGSLFKKRRGLKR